MASAPFGGGGGGEGENAIHPLSLLRPNLGSKTCCLFRRGFAHSKSEDDGQESRTGSRAGSVGSVTSLLGLSPERNVSFFVIITFGLLGRADKQAVVCLRLLPRENTSCCFRCQRSCRLSFFLYLSLFVPLLSSFFFAIYVAYPTRMKTSLWPTLFPFFCCCYLHLMNTSDRKMKTGTIAAPYFRLTADSTPSGNLGAK